MVDDAGFGPAPAPGDPVGRLLNWLCSGLALAGGAVLVALAAMIVFSVVGRALFNAPVPGDFELVEIGVAVAVFAFLPYCQLRRGNIIVDLFTTRAGPRLRGLLDAIGAAVFAAIAGLLTWRMALGGADMRLYGEQTMVLAWPVWWGFVPIVLSAGLLTVVCVYTALRSLGGRP